MKYLLMIAFALTSTLANAADFTMNQGVPNTIKVSGCGAGEVGIIDIRNSVDGTHTLTSRCRTIYCAYTNETPWPNFGNSKWTVKLLGVYPNPTPGITASKLLYDYSLQKVLRSGIETKTERDSIIQGYLKSGLCKGVTADSNVSSL